jgi:hypothetical protein
MEAQGEAMFGTSLCSVCSGKLAQALGRSSNLCPKIQHTKI